MDFRKIVLYVGLVLVGLYLWNTWQREFPQDVTPVATTQQQVSHTDNKADNTVPNAPKSERELLTNSGSPDVQKTQKNGGFIHVKTDVLDILIDPQGGNVVQAKLLKYPQTLTGKQQKVTLFNTDVTQYYVAQSGLTSKEGPDTQAQLAQYSTEQNSYVLGNGQQQVTVPLHWHNSKGLTVTKTFVFHRGSYVIDMDYHVLNSGSKPWVGYVYTQLARTQPQQRGSLLTHYATFSGGAVSSPATHYQKIKFKNFSESPLNQEAQGGWAAMIQQYFLSAWVPPATQNYHYYTKVNNGVYTLGMISSAITVKQTQQLNTQNKLYVGPAIGKNLNALAPYLGMTIDYGWLWFISKLIFTLMKLIQGVIGNWGWSITLTTIVIKLLFFPLSDKSFRSMARMRRLQPRMAQLKERYGDDRGAMGKATMELYRKEKVNPLGGCLPIAIQIPVFIALYWVIIQSVELRQAPWLFWVNDLSTHDPFYILPVLMGGLMLIQQKLSPPPPDPTQAKVMMLMPVIFTIFFLPFPSGLVLYWITNTLVTILHQYYVIRRTERQEKLQNRKR